MLVERWGSGPGHPELNNRMKCRVHALPRDKCGDLRDHCRRKMYAVHQHLPNALHIVALTGLKGGHDMITEPGPHCVR